MRIFKTADFRKFARKQKVEDALLRDAIARAQIGLIDADLKEGVIKQRIAREGEGKRGGHRAILAFQNEHRAVFIHGFSKNEKENVSKKELLELRRLAAEFLAYDDGQVARLVESEEWIEVV